MENKSDIKTFLVQDENGEEILENLSNEEERKAVYDAFQKSYKEAIGKK